MIVLPLGWTGNAYTVPVGRVRSGKRLAHAVGRDTARPQRMGSVPHRDIVVPLGWTDSSYRRTPSRLRG